LIAAFDDFPERLPKRGVRNTLHRIVSRDHEGSQAERGRKASARNSMNFELMNALLKSFGFRDHEADFV
jgi:hypothetical protein